MARWGARHVDGQKRLDASHTSKATAPWAYEFPEREAGGSYDKKVETSDRVGT